MLQNHSLETRPIAGGSFDVDRLLLLDTQDFAELADMLFSLGSKVIVSADQRLKRLLCRLGKDLESLFELVEI